MRSLPLFQKTHIMSDRSISIQYLPFQEENDPTKQLQAGLFLFPGFERRLEPATRPSSGGKVRFITGLDPNDYPESEREEVVQVKKELEDYFGADHMDPTNIQFWTDKSLVINKKTTFLNMNKPEDKLTFYMIKGGAFKEIAPSYEKATDSAVPLRWYLIDAKEYAEVGVADDRKINKAIAALEAIDEDKRLEDIFIIHKVLVSSDRGITLRTPRGMMYKDLSDFIHGKIVKTNKKLTPKQFLDAVELLKKDKKALYISAYLKEGNYFNFLTTADDNQIKNIQTGTKYGGSLDRAARFLASPANQSELENLKEQVEKKWNQ